MRFCRMCGYRLGEGLEEFVPTQMLGTPPPAATASAPAADPFAPRAPWGAGPMQPAQPPFHPQGVASSWGAAPAPKRAGWWTWIIIACLIMLGVGVGAAVLRNVTGDDDGDRVTITNSLVAEADGFETADGGGAFLEGLAGPNSSWERAGLIGGDIITSFDGKTIGDAGDLHRAIAETPPGKLVEVLFIRDNTPGKTMLTTAGRGDWREMEPIDSRPGGRGVLGVNVGRRVRVPSLNIYGVELNRVHQNRPAHLAGLHKGDIVIEFGDKLIRTPGDLNLRIYEAEPGSIVNVKVIRGGQPVVVPVKMGWGRDPE
jgi:membrane-associated protease RseP (regulator of RpoE activity)